MLQIYMMLLLSIHVAFLGQLLSIALVLGGLALAVPGYPCPQI